MISCQVNDVNHICLTLFFFWQHWIFIAFSQAFSSCSKGGLLFFRVQGLLIAVASLVEHERRRL